MDEKKLFQIIDSMKDEMIDFLRDIVRIPSDNPPGIYEELSAYLKTKYTAMGLESEVVKVPDELVKKHGLKTPRYNVLATLKGKDGHPRLILNPHIDTVPPATGWTYEPYGGEVVGDKMYGRGTADSKGQCVVYAYALAAIKKLGLTLKGDAIIVASADEESGGLLGAGYMLDEGYTKGDWAISEGNTYEITNALCGCLHIKVTIDGKASHASMPQDGIDALEEANKILGRLYAYRDGLKNITSKVPGIVHPTMVVGTIEGGVKTNVVPSQVVLTIDRRVLPEEDALEVENRIRDIALESNSTGNGAKVTVERVMFAESYGPTPVDSEVILALRKNIVKVLGEEPEILGGGGFADARFYWNRAGMPSVMYGAGSRKYAGANAHGPDENLDLNDLVKAAKVLALTVIDLLG